MQAASTVEVRMKLHPPFAPKLKVTVGHLHNQKVFVENALFRQINK